MFYKDNSKNRLLEVVGKLDARNTTKINENFEQPEEFIPHGSYTVSNSGGYEIMLNDAGDAARVRDAFGSDNPQTSDWLEIEYIPSEDGESEPVIDPQGYNIPLNQVMRIQEGVNEVFGLSGKEKETKANQQKIEAAKQEIQKYPPTHLFAEPGRNASEQDKKNLMTTRINMAKQAMPILAELMPQLFDTNQSFSGANQLYGEKNIYGLIPTNWYYFVKGAGDNIDNNGAVEKLNQELDGLGQKMGLQEAGELEEDAGTVQTSKLFGQRVGEKMWNHMMENLSEEYRQTLVSDEEQFFAFVKGIMWAIQEESSQYGADVYAKNAGAAPDERV